MQMRGTILYATVYDTDQFSSFLFVNSPPGATSCTGGNTVLTSTAWDNRIGSTELGVCGAAKHHQWSNFTGNNQLVTGHAWTAMNATMNNATSSIAYSP
jgi:hypothetical protein